MVVSNLRAANPELDISITEIVTAGDRDRRSPLEQLGVNVFVKELEEALIDGRIDLAVHSLKDLPTDMPDGLELLGVTERADPRDVLVAGKRLEELASGATIGTDSLRRSLQLGVCRPDLEVRSIRGNVDTRLRKVDSGEVDGVILAAAGLKRIGSSGRITQYLPFEYFLPAVGQGALGLEGRHNDGRTAGIVAPIVHLPTWQAVVAERSFLLELGGGCRAPIAALGSVDQGTLRLEGMVGGVKSRRVLRYSDEDAAGSPRELGTRLARALLDMGASDLIVEAEIESR
jgi:hydroxymethylbilane synthase